MSTTNVTKLLGGILVLTMVASNAQANDLFFEDFEDYNVPGDSNPGKPLLSEGSKELWYAGRFEQEEDGTVDQDLAVRDLPGVYPSNRKFGQFEDDAGILFNISTMGVSNVTLNFEWVTHLAESTDRFVAGYYLGDIDFVNDAQDGSAQPDLVHDFTVDGPAWGGGGWVELLRDRQSNGFQAESFQLPGNQPSVWVAFWLDNGERDYGKVDNIVVTPEPSAALMLLAGSLAAIRRRRR